MNISKRILLGITGKTPFELKQKIAELEKLKIKKASLFLEFLTKKQRQEIYSLLLNSKIKNLPLIHARHDMLPEEYKFLIKNFKTKYFNLHEKFLKTKNKLPGLNKKILIEFNYDNKVPKQIDLRKIKGFCIDLSHFKASQARWTKEFFFVIKKHKLHKLFIANHLNGYSAKHKRNLHTIKKLSEFNYLKTLPKFVFGKYIALETFNPIKEQIKFKNHIIKLLETGKP